MPPVTSALGFRIEVLRPYDAVDDTVEGQRLTAWEVMDGALPPGPAAMAVLARFDPTLYPVGVRIKYAEAMQRCATACHALALEAVAKVSAPVPEDLLTLYPLAPMDGDFTEVSDADLAIALNASEFGVGERRKLASDLTTRYPKARDALGRGAITMGHLYALRELTAGLSDEQCAVVERRVFPRAQSQSVSAFRRSVRRVVASLDPEQLSEAFLRGTKDFGVRRHERDDGTAGLWIESDVVTIRELDNAIHAEAKAWAAQRAAQGKPPIPLRLLKLLVLRRWARLSGIEIAQTPQLTALLEHIEAGSPTDEPAEPTEPIADAPSAYGFSADEPQPAGPVEEAPVADGETVEDAPGAAGFSAEEPEDEGRDEDEPEEEPEDEHEYVRLPLSEPWTPEGLRAGRDATREVVVHVDLTTLLGLREGHADLPGYGPLPIELARDLARSSSWRRLVHEDATGHLLDLGRRRYRPTPKMRDHLVGLGQRCSAPGCGRAAMQFDHAIPWSEGGDTAVSNANPACVHHHRLKTLYGFSAERQTDGSITWTTPSGTHTTPPEDHRITNYGEPP
ncbi:MAG TPA: DUF222 domain-containing protein [Actinomycetes bacterium]|nr:DUF222 domain-containing protein [Actinomycetes bacterium]